MQLLSQTLRVLQMRLEHFEAVLQERFEFRILSVRDQSGAESAIHRLVIRDLIVDIRLVERRTRQAG